MALYEKLIRPVILVYVKDKEPIHEIIDGFENWYPESSRDNIFYDVNDMISNSNYGAMLSQKYGLTGTSPFPAIDFEEKHISTFKEENVELLPAETVRRISENNIWKNIVNAINDAVKTGKTDIIYNDVIPISIENKLKELGYIVEPYEIEYTRDTISYIVHKIGYIVQW